MFLIFTLLGANVQSEIHTAVGRCDCVVQNAQYVFVFEFKVDKTVKEAVQQIENKKYAAPYAMSGKRIVKIGANFSSSSKTLDSWEVIPDA